ncbi:glycoside hydrolase family 3 C-terminal domain-containing protein [Terriglobus sp. TAA 43]|uniref:glycoside hydrolase family 3 C-terminal domain-containing protein n=1 Tax=Terriglobus sp. TAA 43 TaxID=278961 RepID=UPI00068E583C|nr:glycoside hydrolase family 3 C-terminal domain-containing protein [Terriglobus sp. TAA 43]
MRFYSVVVSTAAVLLGAASCFPAVAQTTHDGREVYRDTTKPIEDRITDLMKRFTLQEKAMQLNHTNRGVPRLGLPMWGGWNQTLHGVWSKQPTTLFPMPTAMGATWNPELVHTVADAMSDEARALYNAHAEGPRTPHGLVFRSPVINISRDPRWGRIQEVFSEDPLLTARMGVAYVRGLQGDDVQHLKVAATVKHFAVNNVESGRQHLNATVDERNLFEFWLPHWRAAIVEGHAQSVMSSYNAINGTPDAVNHYLLTDILRKKWGFDGFVTDDLGAVALLSGTRNTNLNEPGQHFSEDPVVAAAEAIRAGNDSDDVEFETNLPLAVQRGLLTEKDVDGALRNVLRVGFRLGAYDPPGTSPYSKIGMDVVRSDAHRALSQQVAEESMTLLLNRKDFLPLQRNSVKSIAVIGPAGGDGYETGNYYGTPAVKTSVTSGLRTLLGSGVKVDYERGVGFVDAADEKEVERAVSLARKSDVVVLCLGTNLQVEAEGRDRRNLNLPGAQQRLLEAVYAANPKVALVLLNAGPLAVTWANDHVPAILSAWYPGELGGTAIARTLFGENNPGGHLPYTVYASLDGVPPQNEYDVSRGYTYQYFKGVPLYPFGHGLSYTHFSYSDLKITQSTGKGASVAVSFRLTNTGKVAGAEVAQVYTHLQKSRAIQPFRTLRGFERVTLQPNESRTMTIVLPTASLGWYDPALHDFQVEAGTVDVLVGSSSEDIRLRAATEVRSQSTARNIHLSSH